MILVLDASALLAIALREAGGDVVLSRIQNAFDGVLIHAVNATEVAFKLMAKGVPENAAWTAATFEGVQRISDVSDEITRTVARLKIANPFLSLGDCFCLSLGEYVEGEVLTSDGGFSRAATTAKICQIR
jgi:PIN domain nuclease of toxin-antitoxin system